jgi:hypothetical protein
MMQTARWLVLPLWCGFHPGVLAQDGDRPLRLNEIFTEGDFDSAHPDWVELRNASDKAEPLDGYAIQIEGLRPAGDQGRFLFEFPEGHTVPAGGFLLVCLGGAPPPKDQRPPNWRPRCSGERTCSGSLCLEYGLDADGGVISLTWKPQCQQVARIPVNAIRYPPLGGGESFGRGSGDDWCELPLPTPGARNLDCVANDQQVVINEVSPVGQPSWVELFLRGPGPVSLGGYRLENQDKFFRLPPIVLQEGDENGDQIPDRFAIIFLEGSGLPQPCGSCAPFNLKAEGDTLLLRAPDGLTWDGVSIPRLAQGETYARIPDGGSFCVTATPSLRAPNPPQCADLPPRVSLIDRFPLRVHPGDAVEVFARALDPSYTEPPGVEDLARVELHWRFTPDDAAGEPAVGIVAMEHGKRVYCERYEEPGIFVGKIPGQAAPGDIAFFVRAHEARPPQRTTDSSEASAYVQARDWQDPLGRHALRLNEVSANSPTAPGDWVELFNPSSAGVSLEGLYVIENNIRPLPAEGLGGELWIEAGSRLVIHLTDVADPPSPYVRILLDDCRDELILLDGDGKTVIDFLLFHEEKIDRTLGRLPDGGDELTVMLPSKGLLNSSSSCLDFMSHGQGAGLVINEYSADNWGTATDPDRGGEDGDWIELFNAGAAAVSLDCWSLSDSWDGAYPGSRKRWTFPDGITVQPGGFVLVWCDNDDDCETWSSVDDPCWQRGDCELHTIFQLNRVKDFVQLLDPLGRVADHALVGFQPRDVSAGRREDGKDDVAFLEPTPGRPNTPLSPERARFLPSQSCNRVRDVGFPPELGLAASPCIRFFQRGDLDDSCRVDISDAISELTWLFQGGDAPRCDDAADANDDGRLDLSDAIYTLAFLFLGGPEPPAPGPTDPGPDLTADELTPCQGIRCGA